MKNISQTVNEGTVLSLSFYNHLLFSFKTFVWIASFGTEAYKLKKQLAKTLETKLLGLFEKGKKCKNSFLHTQLEMRILCTFLRGKKDHHVLRIVLHRVFLMWNWSKDRILSFLTSSGEITCKMKGFLINYKFWFLDLKIKDVNQWSKPNGILGQFL